MNLRSRVYRRGRLRTNLDVAAGTPGWIGRPFERHRSFRSANPEQDRLDGAKAGQRRKATLSVMRSAPWHTRCICTLVGYLAGVLGRCTWRACLADQGFLRNRARRSARGAPILGKQPPSSADNTDRVRMTARAALELVQLTK